MKTITSQKQAVENIKQFYEEALSYLHGPVDVSIETLVKNIPHYRAWYCYFDSDTDQYIFAPSKYIGYSDIDAAAYCEYNRNGLDGRQTESVLSTWYETIPENHEDFELLSEKLREFCSKFDKSPNSLFRINVSYKKGTTSSIDDVVSDFIWGAFQSLPADKRSELKTKINRYRD